MADNAEDFIISLDEQISGPAKVATSALAQLETRVVAQRAVMVSFEAQLAKAADKLATIAAGNRKGIVNVSAMRRQQAAVAALQQKLDDAGASLKGLEAATPLANAAESVLKARDAITAAAEGVRELEAQLVLLQTSANADVKAVDALTAAIEKQRGTLAGTQESFVKMGGGAREAIEAAGGMTGKMKEGAKAAGGLKAQMGTLATMAGPILALAAAVLAVVGATVAASIATVKWVISMADAARSRKLSLEGLAASFGALKDIATILPEVQAKTGLTTDELRGMATELAAAKVSAGNMQVALQALATAKAGGAAAEFIDKLKKSLIATGKVPPELAAQMSKFESIAARKMLSLSKQGETLKKNVGGLFSDISVEGFLLELKRLTGLFDKNTASGRALKFLLEKFFQPIIDGAAAAIPTIERFFIIAITWAIKASTAVRKFFKTEAGKGLVLGLETIGTVLAFVAAAAADAAKPFIAFGVAVAAASAAAIAAFVFLVGAVGGVIAKLKGMSLADIGKLMMEGLANGIKAGGAAVLSAITGVVGGAIAQAKALLKPGSPSLVFMELGMQSGEGMAAGLEKSSAAVQDGMTSMAAPPADLGTAAPGGAAPSVGPSASGPSFSFSNCTFGGDLTQSKLEEWLTAIFHQNELDGEPEPAG